MRSRLLIALSILLAPAFALAAAITAPHTWSELANRLVALMNQGIATLVTAGVAIYFYGIWSNILKFGEDDHGSERKKAFFFWGIVILFVMVSIFGILRIVQTTLFGADALNPKSGPGYTARSILGN